MKNKTTIVLASMLILILIFSCKKINEIVDSKSDQEKIYEYLTSGVWQADSIRTTQRDINQVVFSDTNLLGRKITFIGTPENGAKGKMNITYNKNCTDTSVTIGFRADENYMRLYYTNPSPGAPDVEIIYTFLEYSDKKIAFERDENLVSPTNGASYGFARSLYRLSK